MKNKMPANLLLRSIQNLGFQAVPFAIAVASVPVINKYWTLASLGQLSLVWVLMNYFQFFDFGLGRALTTRISGLLKTGNETQAFISAGIGLQLSMVLSLFFLMIGYFLIQRFWPGVNLIFICALIPVLMITNLLRGVLEGHQKFLSVNVLNSMLAGSNFLIPALIAAQGGDLEACLTVLFIFRLICLAVWFWNCRKLFIYFRYNQKIAKDLMRFGGWLSVSNLVSALMTSFDRFALNSSPLHLSLAYYSTPQEFVTKLWVIPQAVCRSLIPIFSQPLPNQELKEIFSRGLFWIRIVMIPACGFMFLFSHEILFFWLGESWGKSEIIVQILSLGILFNSANWVNISLLVSRGKESATAKISVGEFAIYVPVFILGLHFWGLAGVAAAWTFRLILDYSLFCYLTSRVFVDLRGSLRQSSLIMTIVPLICLSSIIFELSLTQRILIFTICIATWVFLEFKIHGYHRLRQCLNWGRH